MSIELIAIFVTMIIGFLTIVFVIIQTNNQTRTEIREVETNLRNEFKSEINSIEIKFNELRTELKELRTELKSDLNTLELKLNTLLMGLFRNYTYEQPQQKQDKQ